MTVNFIKTQPIGQSGQSPKIVYIDTNDTLATVTAAGYLNNLLRTNPISEGDAVLITTKTTPGSKQKQLSLLDLTITGGSASLVTMSAPSTVASVLGTANRISATGTTNVVLDIDAAYVGQATISTVGSITSGAWTASTVAVPYGGTGSASFTPFSLIAAGTSSGGALTNVVGTGTTGQMLVSQGAGAYPVWQTVAGGGDMLLAGVQTNTGAKTFNSGTFVLAGATSGNITFNATAIAGTNTIALPALSGTVALTSQIPTTPISLANGGTGASLVANNGGIFYSTGTVGAILAGTATASKVLMSGASAAPTWSTATFPSTATGAGKILRANGTNWVASTSTFADTYGANQLLVASSANVVSGLATAANGVLVTSAASVPSISSTLPNAVQDNITRTGTVTNGTWQASTVSVPYGGTGNTTFTAYSVICAGATATGAFQNVSGVGTSGQVLTSQGAGSIPQWSTPGTGGAVDSVTGTAARITISGTAADPIVDIASTYVGQTSITTLGIVSTGTWSADVVALAYGGTAKALTAVNGGIVYTDADSMEILAATATAGKMLRSGSNAAPTWSTATFPNTATSSGSVLRADGTNWASSTSTFANTYAASSLLYSNGANTVEGLAKVNNAVLASDASGVPTWRGLTDGQLLIGSSSGAPIAASITGGSGITVTPGANSISIATTAIGTTWNEVAGTSVSAAVNNGYICQNASDTTVTLPATCAVGDVITVQGAGGGHWILTANTGQTIAITASQSTVSAGNLTATDRYDYAQVQCITANTTWVLSNSDTQGITIN